MKTTLLATVILCGALGCGKAPEQQTTVAEPPPSSPSQGQPATPPPAAKPVQPSTMQTVVDGFTGKAAVEQGKAARAKIEAVSAKENRDLDEALKP
jgi:hypothetical protein